MICTFDKPFSGSTNLYALRDIHIFKAKKYDKTLRIVTPSGTMTVSPSKLLRMSKRIEMYKYQTNPMIMYQFALIPDKIEVDYERQEKLIDNSVMERLKERAIEMGFLNGRGFT